LKSLFKCVYEAEVLISHNIIIIIDPA